MLVRGRRSVSTLARRTKVTKTRVQRILEAIDELVAEGEDLGQKLVKNVP
jgi:hypothetical protein